MTTATLLELDEETFHARIRAILGRHAAVGLAVGVVRDGHLALFHGHGFADVEAPRPVTDDTVFRVGSITKTVTAIAVMQLRDEGRLDLDAPAQDVLRAFRLVPDDPAWRPPTIRDLLTHTAGIGEVRRPLDVLKPLFGEMVPVGTPVPSLVEYYRDGLRVVAEPGTRWIYTDHAFAALGQIVEDVTGIPFDRYVRERILEPLGMTSTDLVRSGRVLPRLARGYTIGRRGPSAVRDAELITVPGGGLFSTTRDMARYVAALLGGGRNEHGTVLDRGTLAEMLEPHYRPDPRLPGMGLAFDRYVEGPRPVFGHGGIVPGFDSLLLFAPADGLGLVAFTNGATRAMIWLPTELGRLLDELRGAPPPSLRTDVAHHPEVWRDVVGHYAVNAAASDIRARLMSGAGVDVFVRGGRPMIRLRHLVPSLLRGIRLVPDDEDDPYRFRVDLSAVGLPAAVQLAFRPDPATGASALHTDLFPMSLRRRSGGARRGAVASRPVRAPAGPTGARA